MKKLYKIQQIGTDNQITLNCTLAMVADVVVALTTSTKTTWRFISGIDEMKRYNEIVTSTDYKLELDKMTEVYQGLNLKIRLAAFHKRLQIWEKPFDFELYQTFVI